MSAKTQELANRLRLALIVVDNAIAELRREPIHAKPNSPLHKTLGRFVRLKELLEGKQS